MSVENCGHPTPPPALLRKPYCYGSRLELCHASLRDFASENKKKCDGVRYKEAGENELGTRRAMRRS